MLTLVDAAEQIRTRNLSPVELTRECLDRIERLNPTLNAFITVTADHALTPRAKPKPKSPPATIADRCTAFPSALKDLFDTAGVLTTAASNQYRDRIPDRRCRSGAAAEAGRRGDPRQAQHARVRLRHERRDQRLWPGEKSLEPGTHYRRLVVGLGGSSGRRTCASRRWDRTRPAPADVRPRCAALWDIAPART